MDLTCLYSYLQVLKEDYNASTSVLRMFAMRNCLPEDYCRIIELCDNPTAADRIAAIILCPDDNILDLMDVLGTLTHFEKQLVFLTQLKIFFTPQ